MTTKPDDKIDADGAWEYSHGLTKRELFAAMALQGMNANRKLNNHTVSEITYMAVQYADALIEALNEGKEQP